MTLLIVGDGIQSQAHDLGQALAGHPEFMFRLGFVELQLFQLDEKRILAFPSAVTKTIEIERAVVQIEYVQESRPKVTVSTPAPQKFPRQVLTEEALLAAIRDSDSNGPKRAEVVARLLQSLRDSDAQIHWTSAGFSIKIIDPGGSGPNLVLGGVNRPRIFYAIPGTLAEQLSRNGWRDETVKRIISAHISFLDRFDARQTLAGEQFNIDLEVLDGKERAFVEGLSEVIRLIQKEAGEQPL